MARHSRSHGHEPDEAPDEAPVGKFKFAVTYPGILPEEVSADSPEEAAEKFKATHKLTPPLKHVVKVRQLDT